MLRKIAQFDRDEAEQLVWRAFFTEVSNLRSHADVVSLLRKQPLPGAPGREHFSNLGLFIQCYEISPSAIPAELAQYLHIIRLIAPALGLPAMALQLIQDDLMREINKRHARHIGFSGACPVDRMREGLATSAVNHGLERRVEDRTAELLEANKELEEFCRSVSHDLRGPLRTIIATSDLLLKEHSNQLDEAAVMLLNRQEASGRRLALMIDELLLLSRRTHQEMVWTEVDISDLATLIGEELSSRSWTIPPRFTIEPGIHTRGDRTLLRAILQNLMENACKFSPCGANVTLSKHLDGTRAIYCVKDEGVGFDMKDHDKIFKPFERLVRDSEFEGTGIGLATVDRLIRRHRGEVWANSELGVGTSIFFTIGL